MLFSTREEIKDEAGFASNANITQTIVEKYQKRANGVVLGHVGGIYDISEMTTTTVDSDSQAWGLLNQAEVLIGAGYLLIKEYGIDGLAENNQGQDKVNEGKSILDGLYSTPPTRLFNSDGEEFSRASSSKSNTGSMPANLSTAPIFTLDDVY